MNPMIISCGKKKLEKTAPACELYCGPLFKKSLAYALKRRPRDQVFILSAKYGLIPIDQVVSPYDARFEDKVEEMGSIDRLRVQAAALGLEGKIPDVVAGRIYHNIIKNTFKAVGENPIYGLPIGKALRALTE